MSILTFSFSSPLVFLNQTFSEHLVKSSSSGVNYLTWPSLSYQPELEPPESLSFYLMSYSGLHTVPTLHLALQVSGEGRVEPLGAGAHQGIHTQEVTHWRGHTGRQDTGAAHTRGFWECTCQLITLTCSKFPRGKLSSKLRLSNSALHTWIAQMNHVL